MQEAGFVVVVEDDGESYRCGPNLSLLHGMEKARRESVPVGCRNGGCGICRVRILEGTYQVLKMSRAQVSEADEAEKIVLACKVLPLSDIRLKKLGRKI
ncbi:MULTISPECIES: 2Fe-2S iron-sulfur cluster binding domain-containing protein [Burkholderia cepacia complex]|uniref:Ferredoxin n=1 Tax=Burkholderia pseudomultivorans TaxID=1207504 RepID=A0A6P2MJR5_9BURK|nr:MULTISPECIES: 2Fe-2S iron-sulfur cluster binding domain-containing protein [Burkholderia cepacia complex]KVS75515.1 hypothetical protein WK41_00810 [Burkholderia cepacia]VWB80603.1 ferredoxin [Burkholderia pseudomultivorans]